MTAEIKNLVNIKTLNHFVEGEMILVPSLALKDFGGLEYFKVTFDRLWQPKPEGIGDERMTNRDLQQVR
jgi:hypothetical protein